jgi:hypothetical protein
VEERATRRGGEGRMEAFASDVGDSDGSSDRPAWSHAGEMMGV